MANKDLHVNLEQFDLLAQRAAGADAAIRQEIVTRMGTAYKIKGSKPLAELTGDLLIAANEGNVYNVPDAITTTANFVEGAGKKHPAGSNVVIVEATGASYAATEDATAQEGKTYYADAEGTALDEQPTAGTDISSAGYYELVPATYKFDMFGGDLSGFQELVDSPTSGNYTTLNASGQVQDSGERMATNTEVNAILNANFGA